MFRKFFGKKNTPEPRQETDLDREISALYGILVDIMGSDRLVLQAGKMDALRYMRSHSAKNPRRKSYTVVAKKFGASRASRFAFRNDCGHHGAAAD